MPESVTNNKPVAPTAAPAPITDAHTPKFVTVGLADPTPLGSTAVVRMTVACQIAGVSRRTIYNWIKHGKVRVCRTANGLPRIYREDLIAVGK